MQNTQINLDVLIFDFNRLGFGLTGDHGIPSDMSNETVIITALLNPMPRLLEGIPVLLKKAPIDYPALKDLLNKHKIWNRFGYFGDFMTKNSDNPELNALVEYCRTQDKPACDISGLKNAYFKGFRSEKEKEWNLLGTPSYAGLEKQFRRYCFE